MATEISITGATGFVGRHLVKQLVANDYKNISIISRKWQRDEQRTHKNGVKKIKADLCQESSIPTIADTEVLIHLAYSRNNFEENLNIARTIIEAAKQRKIQRIIHCSTAVVSGFKSEHPVTESTRPFPLPGYQKNKFDIEQILLTELPHQVELVILRPTVIIGPGGTTLDFLLDRIVCKHRYSRILYWILKNRRVNFVAIDNVVEAILFFIRLDKIPDREIFLISDDDQEDNFYGRADQLIRKCLTKRSVWPDIGLPLWCLRLIFRLFPLHSPPDSIYSSEKLLKLGYRPRVRLSDCIKNCFNIDRKARL